MSDLTKETPTSPGELNTGLTDIPKVTAVAQANEAQLAPDTNSDSSGSLPDLVPASDNDSDNSSTTGNSEDVKVHHLSPITIKQLPE
jgi:hypothetical protein